MGADMAFGSSQRFGVPMGFGAARTRPSSPRADEHQAPRSPDASSAFQSTRAATRRCGMSLQTREQHIRREKANSNICTSQVLLANMAGMYAVYHGPQGLRVIAERIHRLTGLLAEGLRSAGIAVMNEHFFDTVRLDLGTPRAGRSIRQRSTRATTSRLIGDGILGHRLQREIDARGHPRTADDDRRRHSGYRIPRFPDATV